MSINIVNGIRVVKLYQCIQIKMISLLEFLVHLPPASAHSRAVTIVFAYAIHSIPMHASISAGEFGTGCLLQVLYLRQRKANEVLSAESRTFKGWLSGGADYTEVPG